MFVKFSIPVRGVSSFMDSSAVIGVGTCVRKIEYRSRYGLQGENKNIALYVYNYCIV
jgi:hypothetical protein